MFYLTIFRCIGMLGMSCRITERQGNVALFLSIFIGSLHSVNTALFENQAWLWCGIEFYIVLMDLPPASDKGSHCFSNSGCKIHFFDKKAG